MLLLCGCFDIWCVLLGWVGFEVACLRWFGCGLGFGLVLAADWW